jgi:hypothetical protein
MATPISSFSDGTANDVTVTKSTIHSLQALDFATKLDNQADCLAKGKEVISEESFLTKCFTQSAPSTDLTPFLSAKDLSQRDMALDALAKYASGLKELSTVDKAKDVNDASKDISDHVTSINTNIAGMPGVTNPVNKGVLSGIAELAGSLVNVYVGHKRDEALEAALTKANPAIHDLCNLLAKEFEKPNGVFYTQLENSYNEQVGLIESQFKEAKNYSDKFNYAKKLGILMQKREVALNLYAAISSSYMKLAEAHEALLSQLKTGVSANSKIDEFKAEINNIQSLYNQLNDKF